MSYPAPLAARALTNTGDDRGFTLLEVLVAIAILGLGLTVILSSQVGLFAGIAHSQKLSFATSLARCRMSEVEEELVKDGFPLIDQAESGPCCEDEKDPEFGCSWKIETVELPDPPLASLEDGMLGEDGGVGGPLGALAELQMGGPGAIGGDGGAGDLAGFLGESMGDAGVEGIASMFMGIVYPQLKPMLETSIRKVTVSVTWKEGSKDRELAVTQYVTRPMLQPEEDEWADGGVLPVPGLGGGT